MMVVFLTERWVADIWLWANCFVLHNYHEFSRYRLVEVDLRRKIVFTFASDDDQSANHPHSTRSFIYHIDMQHVRQT